MVYWAFRVFQFLAVLGIMALGSEILVMGMESGDRNAQILAPLYLFAVIGLVYYAVWAIKALENVLTKHIKSD